MTGSLSAGKIYEGDKLVSYSYKCGVSDTQSNDVHRDRDCIQRNSEILYMKIFV